MDWWVMVLALLIVLVSGFVQGLVGFGSALASVPLLSMFIAPRIVIPLTLVHGLVMNMYLSVRSRGHIQWRRVLPLFIAGVLGLPFGILLLLFLPSEVLKVMIGLVICVFTVLLLIGFSRRIKREKMVIGPVGFLSGVLNGSVAMSGPPVILFLSNQGVVKRRFRANLVTYFFLLNILTFLLFLVTGILDSEVLLLSALLMPALPIGMICGERLSDKVGERSFRKLALVLVLIAGLSALATGLISLL